MELAIGAFVIVGIGLLMALIVQMGRIEYGLSKPYIITAYLPNASGISKGTAVRLMGVEIGRVERVSISESGERVEVKLKVRGDVRIRRDARLRVRSEGIISNYFLEFTQKAAGGEYLPRDGSAVIEGEQAFSIEETLERLGEVSLTLEKLGKTLSEFVGDESFRKDVKNAASGLSKMARSAPETLERFEATAEEIKKTAEESQKALQVLVDLTQSLNEVVETERPRLAETMKNLARSSESLSRTLDALADITETAREGKGTLGRIVTDEKLYVELSAAVTEMRQALRSLKETSDFLREHPEAILKGKPRTRK